MRGGGGREGVAGVRGRGREEIVGVRGRGSCWEGMRRINEPGKELSQAPPSVNIRTGWTRFDALVAKFREGFGQSRKPSIFPPLNRLLLPFSSLSFYPLRSPFVHFICLLVPFLLHPPLSLFLVFIYLLMLLIFILLLLPHPSLLILYPPPSSFHPHLSYSVPYTLSPYLSCSLLSPVSHSSSLSLSPISPLFISLSQLSLVHLLSFIFLLFFVLLLSLLFAFCRGSVIHQIFYLFIICSDFLFCLSLYTICFVSDN